MTMVPPPPPPGRLVPARRKKKKVDNKKFNKEFFGTSGLDDIRISGNTINSSNNTYVGKAFSKQQGRYTQPRPEWPEGPDYEDDMNDKDVVDKVFDGVDKTFDKLDDIFDRMDDLFNGDEESYRRKRRIAKQKEACNRKLEKISDEITRISNNSSKIKTSRDIREAKKRVSEMSFIDQPRVSKKALWTEDFTSYTEKKTNNLLLSTNKVCRRSWDFIVDMFYNVFGEDEK